MSDVCGSPLALDDVFTPRTKAFDNPAYGLTVSRRNTLNSGTLSLSPAPGRVLLKFVFVFEVYQ